MKKLNLIAMLFLLTLSVTNASVGEAVSAVGTLSSLTATGVISESGLEREYVLLNNYPNPFNPSTTITYQLPERSFVTLSVYDALGKEVATLVKEEKPAGTYQLQYSADNLPSGMYYYRIQAGKYIETRKMMLVK